MVSNFLKNGTNFFKQKQENILSAAAVIALMMLASRFLGLLRDRLLASYFGASADLDVYFAAFRLPDILFQLIIMGALSAAFIPVFSEYLSRGKEKEAFAITNSVLNASFLVFGALAGLIFIFAYPLGKLIAPGLAPWQIDKMVVLTRLMLLGQFFLIASNFLTGVLQSFQRFLVPAVAPLMYNLGIIAGIVILSPGLGIYGPTLGVILGSFLHFIIQVPLIYAFGFRYAAKLDLGHQGVKEVIRLMLPRIFGLAVSQIDPTVDVILASLLGAGSISVFNLALHLQSLPVGVFAFAIGTAALPSLAKEYTEKNLDKFKQIFLDSFHQILFLTVPASVFLLVLRLPIVRLVLGTGKFDWASTLSTALTLGLFSLSICAQSLVHVLARAFYALHNTKTPVVVSLISVGINVVAALILFHTRLEVAGLALAASLANFVNAGLLLYILDKKVGGFERKKLILPATKIFTAATIMGLVTYLPVKILDQVFIDTSYVANLLVLTLLVSSFGLMTYIFLAYLFDLKELRILIDILKRIRNWPSIFFKLKDEEAIKEKIIEGSEHDA
ncbi:murein biosynthesis integral membrane protein MurJ [candidate division WWE3 bacterium CG_4_9_14_3_um_filter_43_9]|uniref:Probable lipid II flippase MurJ n=1 Tax=candidate division WWE3 bacterium CG_4_9_14_3_um_filter_43_9 TaxID=1975082 RepID=A0A2M7WXN8_UNCKA|nr:MAG: murein biosynthesis integral membrane protein MurJ [candidate division WWE3 bacterium CG_4_9_14_3_um_filter_43_9]